MNFTRGEIDIIISNYLELPTVKLSELQALVTKEVSRGYRNILYYLASGKCKGVYCDQDGYMCFNNEIGDYIRLDCNKISEKSLDETISDALHVILSGEYQSTIMLEVNPISSNWLDLLEEYAKGVIASNIPNKAIVKTSGSCTSFEDSAINFIKQTVGVSLWELLEGESDREKAETFLMSRSQEKEI